MEKGAPSLQTMTSRPSQLGILQSIVPLAGRLCTDLNGPCRNESLRLAIRSRISGATALRTSMSDPLVAIHTLLTPRINRPRVRVCCAGIPMKLRTHQTDSVLIRKSLLQQQLASHPIHPKTFLGHSHLIPLIWTLALRTDSFWKRSRSVWRLVYVRGHCQSRPSWQNDMRIGLRQGRVCHYHYFHFGAGSTVKS